MLQKKSHFIFSIVFIPVFAGLFATITVNSAEINAPTVTGNLTVIKNPTNDNGGNADPDDFLLTVGGTGVLSGVSNPFDADTPLAINETLITGYTFVEITGDTKCPAVLGGEITLAEGDDITCTITNDDVAPQLTLIKDPTNDNGGDAAPDDFLLTVGGTGVDSGVTNQFAANTPLAINETLLPGYTFVEIIGDPKCPAVLGGEITLDEGDDITCTITNDDVAPQITLIKDPTNDNGGAAAPDDFLLTVGGTGVDSGVTNQFAANTPLAINETLLPSYAFVEIMGDPKCPEVIGGEITLDEGDDITCTITNNDIAVNFASAAQSADEFTPTMTITVQISGLSSIDVSIPFSQSGKAILGTDYLISASPLVIPAGQLSGEITISLIDDKLHEESENIIVTLEAPTNAFLGNTIIHTATIIDDDVVGITVTPTSGLITSEYRTLKPTFTVKLDTQPTANVTIPLKSSDTTEGTVSPTSLVFIPGNWSTEQTVTVTGVDDDMADGPEPFSIITDPAESYDEFYSNFNPPDVSVTNSDNDSPGYTIAPLSGLFTTEGGGSVNVKILLQSRPTSDVTLTFLSTDKGEGTVDPKSLIVKKEEWASDKIYQFTITGVDDDEIDKPEDMQYNVNITSSSADTNYDDFTQILIVENKDAPNINWVKPVTNGLIHEVDNLVPFYIEVEPTSIEPVGKVTFYRWDNTVKEYRDIGVVSTNPFRVIINPADLNWEWNQIYAFASPPGSSATSSQPWIWIFRGELVYRSFMPFLMK